jgi:hypothetical protein
MSIIGMMRWAGHVAQAKEEKCIQGLVWKEVGKGLFGRHCLDGSIILKYLKEIRMVGGRGLN